MISLIQYIYEAQVDGLKDVKIIRHYTTSAALRKILKSGTLIASYSKGDVDWKGYELHDNYVVSFHDVRTDPEYKHIIDQNSKNKWDGYSNTLGLHAMKICCCVEIDYDKLDKMIQDKTHLLNIYGQKAIDFCNLWNFLVNFKVIQEEIVSTNDFMSDIIDLKNDPSNSPELKKSLDYIFDRDNSDINFDYETWANPKSPAKLGWEKIEEIFIKYFPQLKEYNYGDFTHIPGMGGSYADHSDSSFKIMLFKYLLDELYWHNEDNHKEYQKQLKLRSDFYKRDLKKFTKEDVQILAEYTIKFDIISIVKMLRKHGWRFGDSILKEFRTISHGWGNYKRESRFKYWDDQKEDDWYDGSLAMWIDDLAKSKNRIINTADIEIRIASDINLNKENCKIVIFKGLCNATNQEGLLKFVKKYESKYNIEIIEPKENI